MLSFFNNKRVKIFTPKQILVLSRAYDKHLCSIMMIYDWYREKFQWNQITKFDDNELMIWMCFVIVIIMIDNFQIEAPIFCSYALQTGAALMIEQFAICIRACGSQNRMRPAPLLKRTKRVTRSQRDKKFALATDRVSQGSCFVPLIWMPFFDNPRINN